MDQINEYNSEHSMGRDGLVFVNVRKDIVKLKKEKNLAEAPFKEHGAGTSIRWSHWWVYLNFNLFKIIVFKLLIWNCFKIVIF